MKTKGLVNVTVRNVFVQFPIDDERYELILAVGRRWHSRKVGQPTLPSGDAHINLTVETIEDTFWRCCMALAFQSFHPRGYQTKLDRDRAQRAYAEFDRETYRQCIREKTEWKVASAMVTELMSTLYEYLLIENASADIHSKRTKE